MTSVKPFLSNIKYLYHKTNKKNEFVCAIQNDRDYMEDNYSFYHRENISIYSVYDGHGGFITSQYCTTFLSQRLFKVVKESNQENIEFNIKKLFLEFDKEIYETNFKDGTTATIVVHDKDEQKLYFINLGDSRSIYIKKLSGYYEILYSSVDHKPIFSEELYRIADTGFLNYGRVNGNLSVSRCLGDNEYKHVDGEYNGVSSPLSAVPDFDNIEYNTGIIMLATDGLWDRITLADINDIFDTKSYNKEKMCTYLLELAVKRGSGDNITIMMVEI